MLLKRLAHPSLRTRLLLLILLAVAPLLAVMLFNAAEQRAVGAAQAQADALRLARVSAKRHEQLIEGARQTLIVLSQLPAVRNHDMPACNVLFGDLLRQYPSYANLAALDLDGDVFCSAVSLTESVNAADRPWFQQMVRTRTFTIGDYQVGRITHKAVLTTAYPVTDEAGGLQGIVAISIDTAWLNQLVANPRLPTGSAFAVFDRGGTVLAHYPDPEAWVGQLMDQTPLFRVIQNQHGEGTVIAPGLDGQMRLFGIALLRTPEDAEAVYLAVGVPTAQAFAPVTRVLLRNLLMLSLVTIFSLGTTWLMADRLLVRRLGRLTQVAVRLGAGDLAERFGQSYGSSELGVLARTFDSIAATLEEYDTRRRSAEAALMLDATERKQAEESLRQARDQLQAVLDAMPGTVSWISSDLRYLGCNRYLAEALNLAPEAVVGQAVGFLGTSPELSEFARDFFASPDREAAREIDSREADDSVRRYLIVARKYHHDQAAVFAGIDITQRKRAEEALREYTEQLRVLTARLANAEEGERRRLAQELHDRVGQNLTALSINLNIVRNLLPAEPAARIGPRLADSLALVSETVEHIRDVMAELRPPVLDDYGLLAALRWYGQRFAQRTGLAIATQGAEPTPRLPLATEITLFRIAQEALTNAARHAQARQVTITLAGQTSEVRGDFGSLGSVCGVRLIIADDGTGFDPELHTQPNNRQAWGLLTMSERAESIGGRLVIDAAPGRGTRVIVEVGNV
jgi:signal transduction histidine kinase